MKRKRTESEHLKPLFIDELMKGESPTAAAKKLEISPLTASKWFKLPEVQEELANRRAKVAQVVDYSVEVAMQEAKEAMEFAERTDNANAYVKAVELRSKLQGLLVDRHDVRTQGLFQINIVGLTAPTARPPEQIQSAKEVPALLPKGVGDAASEAILSEILQKDKEEDDEIDVFS